MKVTQKPKIIFIPYPAQGHVTPMLQLASAFLSRGFSPVVMTPESIHRRISTTNEDLGITFLVLSDGQERPDGPPSDFFSIENSMENIMPSQLERLLLEEDFGVACVVVDLLASWAIRVSDRCGVPVAGFWPVMFAAYRMIEAIPELVRRGLVSRKGKILLLILIKHLIYISTVFPFEEYGKYALAIYIFLNYCISFCQIYYSYTVIYILSHTNRFEHKYDAPDF